MTTISSGLIWSIPLLHYCWLQLVVTMMIADDVPTKLTPIDPEHPNRRSFSNFECYSMSLYCCHPFYSSMSSPNDVQAKKSMTCKKIKQKNQYEVSWMDVILIWYSKRSVAKRTQQRYWLDINELCTWMHFNGIQFRIFVSELHLFNWFASDQQRVPFLNSVSSLIRIWSDSQVHSTRKEMCSLTSPLLTNYYNNTMHSSNR